MRTYNEIRNGLECCIKSATGNLTYHGCKACSYLMGDPKCRVNMHKDALAYIQQLEAQVPRWISVEERQPDENDIGMLVVVSGKPSDNIIFDDAIVIGFYYGRDGWVIEGWEEWENPTVTYWMPLPELPKEDA